MSFSVQVAQDPNPSDALEFGELNLVLQQLSPPPRA